MSTQKYINVYCNASLDELYHGTSFVINIGQKNEKVPNGDSIYYHTRRMEWSDLQTYTIKTILCPNDITIDDLSKILNVSWYCSRGAICVYGKWIDIESKLENLANKPKSVMINSSNLSCENLQEAIRSNLHAELRYKLTKIFEHKNVVDKLFELIPQDDINRHVLELLVCIVNSKPLESNVKNAASKLLIDWIPSFAKYMMDRFNAKDN